MAKKADQTASFMVRFSQKIFEENGESKVQWRGKVSHVQGGEDQNFSDFNEAVAFIQEKLAELTLEATKDKSPEQQDGILKKSFSLWKTMAQAGPKVLMDTLKDPRKQVANLQDQITHFGEEISEKVQEKVHIDQWRNASKSDLNSMKESMKELADQMKKLNAKVDALSKPKPTRKTSTTTKRSKTLMSKLQEKLNALQEFQEQAPIRIQTLGQFNLLRNEEKVSSKDWGRDKTVQLFQYFISHRQRHALHREKIMDHIWEDGDDRDFKVALHGINKILEPERAPRTDPKYLIRQGVSYHLDMEHIWIDVDFLEKYVIIGNEAFGTENTVAKEAYKKAIELYQGIYLPNRVYEDWSSEEREKVQVLILGAYITLAEILLKENPTESIRLAQNALSIDPTWEDAYRLQMQAYIAKGNRPQAIKTYQKCVDILDEEFGIDPLPETRNLLKEIESIH